MRGSPAANASSTLGRRRGASPYSGDVLAWQVPYVAAVVESTLAALAGASGLPASQLQAGVAGLRALPAMPGAEIGWVVKARAVK